MAEYVPNDFGSSELPPRFLFDKSDFYLRRTLPKIKTSQSINVKIILNKIETQNPNIF